MDTAAWNRSFAAHFTLVATDGKLLVGFGDIDARSHIDRLFVHKDYQRRGVLLDNFVMEERPPAPPVAQPQKSAPDPR